MVKMENRFIVDWLEFTCYKDEKTSADAYEKFMRFPLYDFAALEVSPILGYTNGWSLGRSGIRWYIHSDRPDMGVHVIVSGSNMGQLLDRLLINPDQDGYALAASVIIALKEYDPGLKFSRIDLAFDDYNKVYTPYDYMYFYMNQRLSLMGAQTAPTFTRCSIDGGGTAYFGSRTSRRMLRIYDKNVESSGRIDAIRYEVELRSEYAERAVKVIGSGDPYDFSDLVSMFVTVHNDVGFEPGLLLSRDAWNKRRKRAGVDEKFAALFSGLTKSATFKVSAVKREFSLDRKLTHIVNNVAPQILLLVDVVRGDWDFVLNLIQGQSYSDRHLEEFEILRAEYDQISMGQALRP